MKLTFIPIIFLILRLSGVILAIPHTYLPYEQRLEFRTTWWNAVLVLLAVSECRVSVCVCVCVCVGVGVGVCVGGGVCVWRL